MKRIQDWFDQKAGAGLYAVALYIIMSMAYLPFVGGMGYNYDDWEGVYLYTQGMSRANVWDYFVIDRPFSSLVHFVLYPVLGTNVPAWHILAMSLHWGAIMLLVLAALRLFPRRVVEVAWTGILLAVFPGITRQFVAFTTMPHYASMFLFAFSLWTMLKALEEERKSIRAGFWAASWLAALAQVFIIEYFALMEAARLFVLIGYELKAAEHRTLIQNFGRAIFKWLPYAAALGAFLAFKFLVLPQWALASGTVSKHEVALFEELASSPVTTLAAFVNLVLQDALYLLSGAWLIPISAKDLDVSSKSYMVSWLTGLIGAAIGWLVSLSWQKKNAPENNPSKTMITWLAIVFGATLLLGGLPAWIIGRQGTVGTWSSRFFLAQVLGAVPLFVLISMLFIGWKRPKAASLFFALLSMGGIAYQFREGNRYTLYWDAQRDYYWQLKERVPGLVDGAFIAAPNTPFARTSDYQIAYAVDLLYNADDPNPIAKTWWFDAPDNLLHKPSGTYKDRAIWGQMRNIKFDSSMAKALPVLYASSRGCMQVLVDDYYQGEPLLGTQEEALFPLARQGLILDSGSIPPKAVFGDQPEMSWCYYYQRIEKLRTNEDWGGINTLWATTISTDENLRPTYGPEYLPIIESYARAGDWASAASWTLQAGKLTKEAKPYFCSAWNNRLLPFGENDQNAMENWEKVKSEFDC